ncbi:MAG: branched-chain amino acid ABC transporter permease [Phycisphaerales bacterium]
MADFFQTLIATIAVGSLYALVALGYTLVYGVLKFINFAHSDIFVLGAWTSFTTATVILTRMGIDAEHAPWWVGVVVLFSAIGVCATTGYLIERFAYRPLRKAPRLNVLITAIGVSLLLQNVGQLPGITVASKDGQPLATVPFGPTPKSMPVLLPDMVLNETTEATGVASGGSKRGVVKLDKAITLHPDRNYRLELTKTVNGEPDIEQLNVAMDAGTYEAGAELATQPRRSAQDVEGTSFKLVLAPIVPIRLLDVLIVGSSLALMAALQLLVFKTKLGTGMRALSYNIETASLMGVNTNFVISFTFIVGTSLAACAAFLYPMKYPGLNQTAHGVWVLLGLKAFVAAVVGGIGNIRGAVLGGFLIAAIEFFGARYVSTELRDVYVFGLLILVLLVRPNGLLGTAVREKV